MRRLRTRDRGRTVSGSAVDPGPETYYDLDDLYAHNTVSDSDSAAINPDIGSAGPLVGAAAVVSGGFWDNNGTADYSGSADLTASVETTTKDFLFIQALSKGSLATNVQCGHRIGVFPLIYPSRINTNVEMYWNSASGEAGMVMGPLDATKRVYWLHYSAADGKVRHGYNQTYTNSNGAAGNTPPAPFPATFGRNLMIVPTQRSWGTTRILNKAGLSQADVLAAVQKVQTVHGL